MCHLSGSAIEAAVLEKLDGPAGRSQVQAEIQRPSSDFGERYREYFSLLRNFLTAHRFDRLGD